MQMRAPEIRAQCLDASLVGREHIFEAWREATGSVLECEPLGAPEDFDASITAYNLDGLVVSRVRFGAARFNRDRAMLRQDESDSVAIGLYLSGSIRGHIGDHDYHMRPDQVSLQDLSLPCLGLAEASEVLTVTIPRDRILNPRRSRRPGFFSMPLSTARGSLLAGTLTRLWDELCAGRVYEPAAVTGAFLGLLNGLMGHNVEATADGQARPLMEQYLRDHLGDPTLGPGQLQRVFHYSRSTIYRLFEPHGGVAAFIRNERLRRCHAELIRPTAGALAVSTVAARHGFEDRSHFSRVFRQQYGIAPSRLTAAAAAQALGPSTPDACVSTSARTIRSWLDAL